MLPVLPVLPAVPGCYALLLRLDRPHTVRIGALGPHTFVPGWYCYCGSAHGPGGLRARLSHHLRSAATPRWHVDYLRAVAPVEAIWLWPGAPRSHECVVAGALAALPGAGRPVPGFGSSDCRCPGHLITLSASRPSLLMHPQAAAASFGFELPSIGIALPCRAPQ